MRWSKFRVASSEWRVASSEAKKLVVAAIAVFSVSCSLFPIPSVAQTPDYKNVGRTPSAEEIKAWDISVGPAGKELPPGSGTAKLGAELYAKKCVACHGANLEGNPALRAPRLRGGQGTLTTLHVQRSIGSYWPFATTLWDFINRAMPPNQGGSLKPDEVYSLAAFLLYKNDIIKESDAINDKTLPTIKMPNRDNFIPLWPEWDKKAVRPFGAYQ